MLCGSQDIKLGLAINAPTVVVLAAPILWPSGLALSAPIRACCAYALAFWAGALYWTNGGHPLKNGNDSESKSELLTPLDKSGKRWTRRNDSQRKGSNPWTKG